MSIFMPVQPRACGERALPPFVVAPTAGSAPRVRGTVVHQWLKTAVQRFSPARAGNGRLRAPFRWARTVQPRACGERIWPCSSAQLSGGSAPRVRGTGRLASASIGSTRFSPARAGNGRRRTYLPRFRSVQPRACGERSIAANVEDGDIGSAPRVRGTEQGRRRRL